MSFGCTSPQAKVHVVLLFTLLRATVLQSYFETRFIVLQLCDTKNTTRKNKRLLIVWFLFFMMLVLAEDGKMNIGLLKVKDIIGICNKQ